MWTTAAEVLPVWFHTTNETISTSDQCLHDQDSQSAHSSLIKGNKKETSADKKPDQDGWDLGVCLLFPSHSNTHTHTRTHSALGCCYVTTGMASVYKEDAEKVISHVRPSQLGGLMSNRHVWTQDCKTGKSLDKKERNEALTETSTPTPDCSSLLFNTTHTETTECGAYFHRKNGLAAVQRVSANKTLRRLTT